MRSSDDYLIVYREWPAEAIAEALREFNDQMHDGAGVEEILAGLHGLDFLTRRSTVDANLQGQIDGAITEARMRIELISAKDAEDRSAEEQRVHALNVVGQLHRQVDAFYRRFCYPGRFDADEVRELVRLRVERSSTQSYKGVKL